MADAPLLTAVFPEFAAELRDALSDDGRSELSKQIDSLRIPSTCRCHDSFCTSFYTGPRPDDAWGPGLENVVPDVKKGMVVLDVVDGAIRYIEVNRGEMRPAFQRLQEALDST